MKKLIEDYLMNYHGWSSIYIDYYNVDGATCDVKFRFRYFDSDFNHEKVNINVWDMLVFLNTGKTR